jgi:restriction endonuclease Mrr
MNEVWPSSKELTEALLRVLVRLGGAVNVTELDREVIREVALSPSQLEIKRSGNRSEIRYRLAWVRTKAKQNGLVTREANRVWKLTEKGRGLVHN